MADILLIALSTLGISIILYIFATGIIDWINTFIYFFIRDNAEVMGEIITGVTMASAGTPGHVMVVTPLLSQNYDYWIDFEEKVVFVSGNYKGRTIFKVTEDLLAKLMIKIPSTLGISVTMPQETLLNVRSVVVEKNYDVESGLNVSLGGWTPSIPAPSGVTFLWPTAPSCLTSPYGYREVPLEGVSDFHNGIDIRAPTGTPIYASQNGVVDVVSEYKDTGSGLGNFIKIKHATEDGEIFYSYYAHIKCGGFKVIVGDQVTKGQHIADSGGGDGCRGKSTGPHLHFEIRDEVLRSFDPCPAFENYQCTLCG